MREFWRSDIYVAVVAIKDETVNFVSRLCAPKEKSTAVGVRIVCRVLGYDLHDIFIQLSSELFSRLQDDDIRNLKMADIN